MPSPLFSRREWLRSAAAAGGLAAATWLAWNPVRARVRSLLRESLAHVSRWRRTSLEQRRRLTYGDRDRLGYGYLVDLLSHVPERGVFPQVRYPDFLRRPELVFPGGPWRIEPRWLVGIGLGPADLRPAALPAAIRVQPTGREAPGGSTWRFATGNDYERLCGFLVRLASPVAEPVWRFELMESPKRRVVAARWEAQARPLERTPVSAPPAANESSPTDWRWVETPLEPFSFGRGATDFLVGVEATVEVVELIPVVQKVVLDRFEMVHRDRGCWAAVESSWLATAPSAWREFFARLRRESPEPLAN